jgi:cell division septum initiation protein DivIVA
MTDVDKTHPEFAIAMRGYDRLQVDGYIERLTQLLQDADDRVRAAEAQTEHASVGPKIAQIFQLAMEEADELRQQGEREAEQRAAGARQRADKIVRTAKRLAADYETRARREHGELLGELAGERDELRAEVMLLERQRAELADHLRRLHDAIGRFAAVAEEPSAGREDTTQTRQLKAVGAS